MSLYKVNEELVIEKIAKLQPLNYNQFKWWRRYDSPNKPLHPYSALLTKIQNGDYEFSHFYWQAKFSEIEINEIHQRTWPDAPRFNEEASLHKARRKRLLEDFEKDEEKKLLQIEKDFHLHFKMSRAQIREEMFEFGNTLENFYHYCDKQFGTRQEKLKTRGRPRKYI